MPPEQLWEDYSALPVEAQKEVAVFVAFLRRRYGKAENCPKSPASDLSQEPFIGMWHDREDMTDSMAWVRKHREKEWMR